MRSRRIVSDLAYPGWTARNSHHRVKPPRFQKHKGVLAFFHLPERMLKLVGKLPGTDAL